MGADALRLANQTANKMYAHQLMAEQSRSLQERPEYQAMAPEQKFLAEMHSYNDLLNSELPEEYKQHIRDSIGMMNDQYRNRGQ